MKNTKAYLFGVTTAFIIQISGNAFASGSEHMGHENKQQAMKANRKELKGQLKTELLAVFKANENLHSAFYSFDAKKVEAEAKKVASAISTIKNPEVKKLLAFSEGKLKEMTADKSQDTLNQNYHLVSMALIHVLKRYDIGNEYNAYSCPMVKKKWVQNSKKKGKVHNPYAANMPGCGTKDTVY